MKLKAIFKLLFSDHFILITRTQMLGTYPKVENDFITTLWKVLEEVLKKKNDETPTLLKSEE